MLELKNLNISLKKDGRQIISDFSFSLSGHDKAVIIGEEGNGKSTLLKYIYDPLLTDDYCECSGEVIKKGKLAYLSQTIEDKYLNCSLAKYFEQSEYYYHIDILSSLSLPVDFIQSDRKISTLSGGERVKIQLAKILMELPDVLLLDEPTNDLDIYSLRWLESFIAESPLPVLYISHDETLIKKTANVIVHMEQIYKKTRCRTTVARCSYSDYISFRADSFAHNDQVAQKQRDNYEKQLEKWQSIYDRVSYEQNSISRRNPSGGRLLKKKMHSTLAMKKRIEREKEEFLDFSVEEDAILAKFDGSIALPAGKQILDLNIEKLAVEKTVLAEKIKLAVTGGEHIGITGRNGAGKSTLLALIWQELKCRKDITPAYMPQNYYEVLDYNKTPIEYLSDIYSAEDVTRARTFMGSMKFTHDEMTGKIKDLSGGQQAKILFLDMVLRKADVLILDEPTRNFSPLSCPVIRRSLRDFKGAVISISHDRRFLSEVCDKVYELRSNGLFIVDKSEILS